jgi:hypothetical protein
MKKKWIIILSLAGILPVVFLSITFLILYSQQEKITKRVLVSLNEHLEGELEIRSSSIDLFEAFPYVSIDLREVRFFENKQRDTRPLYEVADIYIGFDIRDIVTGNNIIKSITLKDGHLYVHRYEDGNINVLIAKNIDLFSEKEKSENDSSLNLELQRLTIENFHFLYEDDTSGDLIDNHFKELVAKIKYAKDHFYIDLESDMDFDLYKYNQPTFFTNKHIALSLNLDLDQSSHLLNIFPSKVSLNEATFETEGSVDLDDFLIDIRLKGDKPDFNIFAAFSPPEIEKALANYSNSGQIYFDGVIKGKFSDGELPFVRVDFGCENAHFLNKNVGKKVEELSFSGFLTNGEERTLESFIFQLNDFHAVPEEGIFDGKLVIRNFKDPFVKVNLHADLDLEFIGQFFQLEGLEKIKGKILLDMDFDELIDLEFPGENLAQLKMGIDSELTIKNLEFLIPDYPLPIKKMNAHAIMRNGAIVMDAFSFEVGNSNVQASGSVSDFPALLHRYDEDIRIELKLNSDRLDFPELLSVDSGIKSEINEIIENFKLDLAFESRVKELFDFKYLPQGKFFIDTMHASFKNYPHRLHDFKADIFIHENSIKVKDFYGEIDNSDFHFSGSLDNYKKWFQKNPVGDSKIEFDLKSKLLIFKDLLTYNGENYLPEDYRNEEIRNLKLHGRVELHYNKGFESVDLYLDTLQGKLKIHPLKLEKFNGRIHIENEHLTVDTFSGKMGQSDFNLSLSYFMGENKEKKSKDNFVSLKAKSLDLDELMNYEGPEKEVNHEEAFNIFNLPFPDIRLVAQIDKLNYHRYWLEDVASEIRIQEDHFLYVDNVSLKVADGGFTMKGYFNGSDPENIYFSSNITANNLDIDKLMIKFDNFGQDTLVNENIHGRISGIIDSTFKMHPDFTPIIEKSEAHMELVIADGSLVKFPPLEAMSKLFKDKNLSLVRFDTIENIIDLKDGALSFPNMNINTSLGFLELSGKQGIDKSMEYFIRIPMRMVTQVGFRTLFGRNQNEVEEDQLDEIVKRDENKKVRFLNVKVSGTAEDYKISLGRGENQ